VGAVVGVDVGGAGVLVAAGAVAVIAGVEVLVAAGRVAVLVAAGTDVAVGGVLPPELPPPHPTATVAGSARMASRPANRASRLR
jgi:hypothetical protein